MSELDKILQDLAFKCAGGITDNGEVEYADAKKQIVNLITLAQVDELRRLHTRRHYGKDYEASLDALDDYKDARIAELLKNNH